MIIKHFNSFRKPQFIFKYENGNASSIGGKTLENGTPTNGESVIYNSTNETWEYAAPAGGGDMLAANNLSDVASQQTALDNVTDASNGTAAQVLTTDGTNASWEDSTGAGTVTSVSVVSANGLAGTVATSTTTPAITLSTSITGILKGNGTAISTATAGTDYYNPGGTDVAIADGGTGASTQATALDAIADSSSGSADQVLTTDGTNATWQDAAGGTSVWNEITSGSYTATPTDTNTLAMSATAGLAVGQGVRYTIATVVYYGQIIALTTNTSIDIRGASLSADVTKLEYSITPVETMAFSVNGYFADAANTALIENDLLAQIKWKKGAAYCVGFDVIVGTDDSGANQPNVNVRIGSTTTDYVSTANTNTGLDVAETWSATGIDIATAKYAVALDDEIELKTDASGSNNDASNLTVLINFVLV